MSSFGKAVNLLKPMQRRQDSCRDAHEDIAHTEMPKKTLLFHDSDEEMALF